jgi:hypothetical protein
MKTEFETSTGRPSAYALHCGYIEQVEINGHSLTLWQEGGKCYHVHQHDHGIDAFKANGPRVGKGRIFWDSFPTLTEARKRFDAAKKVLTLSANA